MGNHQHVAYNKICRYTEIQGKTVLEIGGNQRLESAKPFLDAGASKIIVSGLGHVSTEKNEHDGRVVIMKASGHAIKSIFGANTFDIIYGISVVEHIPMLAHFLEQVFYTLKPGGFAFFEGSPIWTSAKGHHIWVKTATNNYLFDSMPGTTSLNPIPEWGHLLMDRPEMELHLLDRKIPENDISSICSWIYEKDFINRASQYEIATSFSNSPLIILDTGMDATLVPPQILSRLRANHGDKSDYGVTRVQYILTK